MAKLSAQLFVALLLSLLALCPRAFAETLTMDVWEPYAPEPRVAEFKKYIKHKYHKDINVVVKYVYSPNEFFDRVRANQTDIISPSHNLIHDDRFNFVTKDLVIPVDKKLVKNLKGVEKYFLTNKFIVTNGKLYGVPFASGAYGLLYRSADFKEPPTTWDVLWDPQYRGRYAISKEFYESNIYITALSMGIPPDKMFAIESLKAEAFEKRLTELLRYANYLQGVPHDKDVTKSVLTTAWGFSHSVHNDKKKEWSFAYPKEGITLWTDYLLVTRAVKRSKFAYTLAMEWLNFVGSPEFQRNVTIDLLRCYSSVPKAYDLASSSGVRIDPKEKAFLFKNAIYWPELTARNRNGMKLIYDTVEKKLQNEKRSPTSNGL